MKEVNHFSYQILHHALLTPSLFENKSVMKQKSIFREQHFLAVKYGLLGSIGPNYLIWKTVAKRKIPHQYAALNF